LFYIFSVNLENKTFKQKVAALVGGVSLLVAVGFAKQETRLLMEQSDMYDSSDTYMPYVSNYTRHIYYARESLCADRINHSNSDMPLLQETLVKLDAAIQAYSAANPMC
jgi:hypothetical protein